MVKRYSSPPGAFSSGISCDVISVSVSALSAAGFCRPRWPSSSVSSPSQSFQFLQATWQARQPMHLVTSISVVFVTVACGGRGRGDIMTFFPWGRARWDRHREP